jgi:hypothetical protein
MAVLALAAIAAAPVVVATATATATATAGAATATGGVAVAATGSATSTGVVSGAVSIGISLGPVGWMCLGCSTTDEVLPKTEATYTLDCWKPVLHDESANPSNGMLLKDVLADPRIKKATIKNENSSLPEIILQNIWDEQFRIEYLELQTASGGMAAHAVRI